MRNKREEWLNFLHKHLNIKIGNGKSSTAMHCANESATPAQAVDAYPCDMGEIEYERQTRFN